MAGNIRKMVQGHVQNNRLKYFFFALSLVVGIVAGAMFVNALSEEGTAQLADTVNSFCSVAAQGEIQVWDVFKESMISNGRNVLLLWICGISVFLAAVPALVLGTKGFTIGFTLGFMSLHYGIKGFLFAFVSVLPQFLIIIPALLFLSVFATNYAWEKRNAERSRTEARKEFLAYCYSVVIIFLPVFAGIVLDAFVSPVFIKMISGVMI